MSRLGLNLDDVIAVEPYDGGWRPVMERIAARQDLPTESVITTHACSMANHLALAAFVEPGDDVVLETPVYEPLVRLADYLGARVIPLQRREENGWRLDPDDARRALTPRTALVVFSNLHNPTGAHDGDDVIAQIAADSAAQGAHVFVDEVYLDFLHPRGVRSAVRLAPNIVASNSMTKVYGLDALRFGWVLAQPPLGDRIRRLNDLFSTGTAHPSARIAYHALGMADTLIAEANALHARNAEIVDQFIQSEELLSWTKPTAGAVGFVRVRGTDTAALADRLHREFSVAVVPGNFFAAPGYMRIGWSLETGHLEAALNEFRRCLRSHRRQGD